jgi:hypothetical protein
MRVRGVELHIARLLGRGRGAGVRPRSRLISAGIAALAIGFAIGLRAVPPAVSDAATIQPRNFDQNFGPWASLGPQVQDNRRLRVASLETEAVFPSATRDWDRWSEFAESPAGRASSAEDPATDAPAASFDERFASAVGWPGSRPSVETDQRAGHMLSPSLDSGGHAAARRAAGPSARSLATLPPVPPASASKKLLRVADASVGSSQVPVADDHTAIYDIVAQRVYLPNGQRLEAHSGYGSYLDDPRYVSEKDMGPTPPNVYDLTLREEPFHGVRAIRLNPVGGGNMYGRDGMLAHSYMLGPNGQSNGCVSFNDYPTFLNAVLSGEVNRLVVVERLTTTPSPMTAWGWIPEKIKALFGRS